MTTERILVLGTVGREMVHSFGITSPMVFGGTAFYAAQAIMQSGGPPPLLVSVLGNDLSPDQLMSQFVGPIDLSGLMRTMSLPSFFWEGRYDDSFEESTTTVLENRLIDGFEPDWLSLRQDFPDTPVCYLAAFDPRVQLACCRHFAQSCIVSETLQYWIGRDRQGVLDLAKASNGFVVTERECRDLWQLDPEPHMPHEQLKGVVEAYGLDFLIVTFADRGSQVFDAEGTFFAPALTCETVDSTGAGNAFTGGIVAHLAQCGTRDRPELLDAVSLGTAMASLQVRSFSNHTLRTTGMAGIEALRQEARSRICWFHTSGGPNDHKI